MAHTFKLKYGSPASWSYIDLTDTNHGNLGYYPGSPEEGATEIIESGKWRIAGSSVSDMITKIGEIENVFRMASAYEQDKIGAYQVRLTVQLDGVAETWESPVFEGRVELPETVLGVDWANRIIEAVLIWRRAAWWERLIDVPTANPNHARTTDAVNVYSWNDGSGSSPNYKVNYLDILAADIASDYPAPVVAEITFGATTTTSFSQIMVLNNARADPSLVYHWSEGETGSGDTTDATRSGGKYHDFAIPADAVGSNFVSTNAFGTFTGAWLRTLISLKFTGTIKARPYIIINGNKYYGPTSILTNAGTNFELYDLGMTYYPPIQTPSYGSLLNTSSNTGINIICPTGITVSLDYFMITPIDYFSQVNLDSLVGESSVLVLDYHDQFAYEVDKFSAWVNSAVMIGHVSLVPNIGNRLMFKIAASGVDNIDADDLLSIKLHAWIRKKTL